MGRFSVIPTILLLFFCYSSFSQEKLSVADTTFLKNSSDSTSYFFEIIPDGEIVGMLDSLMNIKVFKDYYYTNDSVFLKTYESAFSVPPIVADSIISDRIKDLALNSPLPYVFNSPVKNYIDAYAVKKHKYMGRVLGLSYIYFPMMDEMLDKYGLPLELKYLSIVESALNPAATSRAGARGLWQFMLNTGKLYGLNVTSYIDDRCDIYLCTDAACRHLKDLYGIYGDWWLVLAAYNAGAGNVNRAIRRSGGKMNFWDIYNYLPAETRGYVPAFIAVSYVMHYSKEHELYPLDPGVLKQEKDTVSVKCAVNFDQLSQALNMDKELVQLLNPRYKKGIVPACPDNPLVITLPKNNAIDFINNEERLYEHLKKEEKIEMPSEKLDVKSVYYTVRSGDNLTLIARKFGTSVADLVNINGLKTHNLNVGQKLLVKNTGSNTYKSAVVASAQSVNTEKAIGGRTEKSYVVRSGDSLYLISKKYNCSVDDIRRWNGLKSTTINVGQKLKIY